MCCHILSLARHLAATFHVCDPLHHRLSKLNTMSARDRDHYSRRALRSRCMHRVRVQPGRGYENIYNETGAMLHDLIDIYDDSFPEYLYDSDITNNFVYLYKLKSNGSRVVCKVLEYCGESLLGSLRHEKRSFREAVLEAYSKLDMEPVHLVKGNREDYGPSEIIRRPNGQPCLIDFSKARQHIGECRRSKIRFNTPRWPISQRLCGEILAVTDDADFFTSGMLVLIPNRALPLS
ncbi:uncharacterized protein C8Q71DRAFT_410616 [Rhodofomes roseus]|uniref:Integrase catalytic domain-containing protein n=1 Tax=Rhodofomes roseus TaxID=34475 RepID=A0ABQ8JYN3_9APHY|nr:uncharacterized protein C8Q71DRAFT_410616 [Rhodofomes roseus]KAH9829400.1 hypothetical protein C8Q71DRAFT_410616 [Rhodofomes roseus]